MRLLGHAGTDVELAYRDIGEIKEGETRDPLFLNTLRAIALGLATGTELNALYEEARNRVHRASQQAVKHPRLASSEEIVEPLAAYSAAEVRAEAERDDYDDARIAHFGTAAKLPESSKPRPLAQLLNWGLHDLLSKYPETVSYTHLTLPTKA